MRKLVFTISCGKKYSSLSRITHPSIKSYAKKIGAEFLCVKKSDRSSPHWEKMMIFNLLEEYDRILYIDTDIIVREDSPDIFEAVPEDRVGMFNEAPYTDRSRELLIDCCRQYGVKIPEWDGKYFNSGVIVISKVNRELFRSPVKEFCSFYEQTYLNMMIASLKIPMFDLPYKFNRMTCVDRWTGEHRLKSYFVHYAGCPDIRIVYDLSKSDLKDWRIGKKFKKHICINISGGLGDQVNAEPAVRFAKENKIFGDAEIVVNSHWPRIFEHLEDDDLSVFRHGDFIPKEDTPYYVTDSLPGPETVMWSIVSNVLCHTVDYCSMAIMRRILSPKEKRVQLSVRDEDFKEVEFVLDGISAEDIILVHPGRHWESKTFPEWWWQDLIDQLSRDFKVAVIGKEFDGRGIVNLDTSRVINLKNRLSLGGLFALISKARILISNDSAPIHIAGAFDNEIIFIPSCKEPCHALPWRFGSFEYKTKSFFKRIPLRDMNSSPTEIEGVRGEKIIKDWSEYLPNVEDIVSEINGKFERI